LNVGVVIFCIEEGDDLIKETNTNMDSCDFGHQLVAGNSISMLPKSQGE
jgi:hypothetical protein